MTTDTRSLAACVSRLAVLLGFAGAGTYFCYGNSEAELWAALLCFPVLMWVGEAFVYRCPDLESERAERLLSNGVGVLPLFWVAAAVALALGAGGVTLSAVANGLFAGFWGAWLFGRRLWGDDDDMLKHLGALVSYVARYAFEAFRSESITEAETAWCHDLASGVPDSASKFLPDAEVPLHEAWPAALYEAEPNPWALRTPRPKADEPALEEAYYAEVFALARQLKELEKGIIEEPEPPLSEWRKRIAWGIAKNSRARARQATAVGYWAHMAIPYRRIGERIFKISASPELYGPPLVHAWSIECFLAQAAVASSTANHQVRRLGAQRDVLGVVLIAVVLSLLAILMSRQ